MKLNRVKLSHYKIKKDNKGEKDERGEKNKKNKKDGEDEKGSLFQSGYYERVSFRDGAGRLWRV